MLVLLLCVVLLIVAIAPETTVGRALRRLLVEVLARLLSRLTTARIILGLGFLAASWAILTIFKSEGLWLIAQGGAEGLVWLTTFDVIAFLDVFVTLVAMAATARLRAMRDLPRFAVAWLARRLGVSRRGARRRARRRRAGPPPANDDGEGWAVARLAA